MTTGLFTWLLPALLEHSVKVLILAAVIGVGVRLARRTSARTGLFVWASAVCAVWLLPVAGMLTPDLVLGRFWDLVPTPVAGVSQPLSTSGFATVAGAVASEGGISWMTWLPTIVVVAYLAGAAFLLTRVGAGWWRTRRRLRTSRAIDDGRLSSMVQACAAALGRHRLTSVVEVVECDACRVPYTCGIVRSTVVLPSEWRSWSEDVLQMVLLHELAHVARRDTTVLFLATAYRAVAWLNPAAWWLRTRVHTLMELASDEAVLTAGASRTAYAELLLTFVSRVRPLRADGSEWHLAMANRDDAAAERRFEQILQSDLRMKGHTDMGSTRTRLLIVVAVILVAMPMAALTLDVTQPSVSIPTATTVEAVAGAGAVQLRYVPSDGPAQLVGAPPVAWAPEVLLAVQNNSDKSIRAVGFQFVVNERSGDSNQPRLMSTAVHSVSIAPRAIGSVATDLFDPKYQDGLKSSPGFDGGQVLVRVSQVRFDDGTEWPVGRERQTPSQPQSVPQAAPNQEPQVTQASRGYPFDTPGLTRPIVKHRENPKYTPEALRAKVEGIVELKVLIETDGTVAEVEVTTSVDTELGLDDQAVNAAREWTFEPAILDGQPVPVWVVLQLEFRIHK